MNKILYTATAKVTGGREHGHGRTDDGALEVDIRIPAELGGPGGGTNPEQLFAVGYAACFESALDVVARRQKADGSHAKIESHVMLQPSGDGGYKLSVRLDVTLPAIEDPDSARMLVRAAHAVCPYSNATRGNIDVGLTVNGVDLAEPTLATAGSAS
jgi:osmotically inducible protein OsmC